MDRLFDAGHILLGGPYSDSGQALLVMEGASAAEVEALLKDDPWILEPVLPVSRIVEWTVFLDARRRASSG